MSTGTTEDPRLGQVVGKYTLTSLVGRGGMATVYAAVHRNANRVAIKMLHPEFSLDTELRARFLREGYVANTVSHRGAVRVLDDDVAPDGAVFLVMELLEGTTVDARLAKDARLPVREALEITHRLLDVLASAHDKGIVHRDIKPENLFLTTEGELKVLDFGIARLRENGAESASHTRTGRMIGTPAFMPPEQALGRSRDIDARTDLWSVGATLFLLLTGKYVHHAAQTTAEMLIFAGSRPAPPIASVSPELPPFVQTLVDRALANERTERWQSAREMSNALEAAYEAAFGSKIPGARAPSVTLGPEARGAPDLAKTALLGPGPEGNPVNTVSIERAPPTAEAPMLRTSTTVGLSRGREEPGTAAAEMHDPIVIPKARLGPIAAALVLLTALGGIAVAGFVHMKNGRTGGPSVDASATGADIGTPSARAPIASAPAALSTSSAAPSSVSSAGIKASSAPPSAPPTAPRGGPATGATVPPATGTASARPAVKNCDPWFTVDAAGHHHPKPECL